MQLLDNMLGKLLKRLIKQGELTVIDARGYAHRFGAPDPDRAPVTIRFTDGMISMVPVFGVPSGNLCVPLW